jgi:signal transduction histidine kinase
MAYSEGGEWSVIANDSMQVMGALTAGIAHDFNEDLTVILSSLNTLMEDLGGGHPSAAELKQIRQAAARCVHRTESLLAFTCRVDRAIRPFHLPSFFAAAERVL